MLILPPSPLLSINFFDPGNFLNHSTEGFPYEFFWYRETTIFERKVVILPPSLLPLLIYKLLRYQNFSETQKFSPTKFFGTVRQQIFDGES